MLYTANPFPVMTTGISLCSDPHREIPVINTGSLQWEQGFHVMKQVFPVRIYYTGKTLFWPCTDPVLDCSVTIRMHSATFLESLARRNVEIKSSINFDNNIINLTIFAGKNLTLNTLILISVTKEYQDFLLPLELLCTGQNNEFVDLFKVVVSFCLNFAVKS